MAETKEISSPEQTEVERWETETLAPVLRKTANGTQPTGTPGLDPVDAGTGLPAQRSDGDLGPTHLGSSEPSFSAA